MTAPTGTPAPTGEGTPAPEGTPAGQPAPEGQEQGGQIKLTAEQQSFVDQLVARRLREEKQRMDGDVERRVQEMLEREKLSAAEKAQLERDEARKQAEEATTASKRAVAEARVETALLAAGIKPARLEAVARLVDLEAVGGAEDQKAAATEAVQKVLADFPEFRPTPGASGGELNGGGGQGAVTLEQFKGMDYDARAKLAADNITLYRQLRDQEQGA